MRSHVLISCDSHFPCVIFLRYSLGIHMQVDQHRNDGWSFGAETTILYSLKSHSQGKPFCPLANTTHFALSLYHSWTLCDKHASMVTCLCHSSPNVHPSEPNSSWLQFPQVYTILGNRFCLCITFTIYIYPKTSTQHHLPFSMFSKEIFQSRKKDIFFSTFLHQTVMSLCFRQRFILPVF